MSLGAWFGIAGFPVDTADISVRIACVIITKLICWRLCIFISLEFGFRKATVSQTTNIQRWRSTWVRVTDPPRKEKDDIRADGGGGVLRSAHTESKVLLDPSQCLIVGSSQNENVCEEWKNQRFVWIYSWTLPVTLANEKTGECVASLYNKTQGHVIYSHHHHGCSHCHINPAF